MKDDRNNKEKVIREPLNKKESSRTATVINCTALNLRTRPDGDVITTIPVNTVVTVIRESVSWSLVRIESGQTGYVKNDFLDMKR